MFQRLSRCTLSNALLKSTKFTYSCLCHSVHCSMMLRSAKIWSVQPRCFLNPACSFLSTVSTASVILRMIILAMILQGTDNRVIPLQLLQSLRVPFFGILIITPLHQSSGTISSSHTVVNSGWRMVAAISESASNSSASRLSYPGDFPF